MSTHKDSSTPYIKGLGGLAIGLSITVGILSSIMPVTTITDLCWLGVGILLLLSSTLAEIFFMKALVAVRKKKD